MRERKVISKTENALLMHQEKNNNRQLLIEFTRSVLNGRRVTYEEYNNMLVKFENPPISNFGSCLVHLLRHYADDEDIMFRDVAYRESQVIEIEAALKRFIDER
jgi:hypothetical protein